MPAVLVRTLADPFRAQSGGGFQLITQHYPRGASTLGAFSFFRLALLHKRIVRRVELLVRASVLGVFGAVYGARALLPEIAR
ncbi:MAG: hypothetical protein WAK12_02065 [Acidimicrobiales bacterium]